MTKRFNKLVSCMLVFCMFLNLFAIGVPSFAEEQDAGQVLDEQQNATQDGVNRAEEGLAQVDDSKLESKWYYSRKAKNALSEARSEKANATTELGNAKNDINETNANEGATTGDKEAAKGEGGDNLSGLLKVAAAAQEALIKIGSLLEKIGDILKKVGKALKIVGKVLQAASCTPWTAWLKPIGEALEKVGKIVYQIGNVMYNVGKMIRTVGEAAKTGDVNFGQIVSSIAGVVSSAWTEGGTEYDNIDTSAYEDKAKSVMEGISNGIDKVKGFFGGDKEGADM